MKRQRDRLRIGSRPLTLDPRHQRQGAFLVIAMVCLLLTSMLLGAVLKLASASRQQAQFEAAALQAEWLAESALDRAAAKLSSDANYQGETWDITAEDLGGRYQGQVFITVNPKGDSPAREVEAIARFPLENPRSAKRTKQIKVAINIPIAESPMANSSPAFAEKAGKGESGR